MHEGYRRPVVLMDVDGPLTDFHSAVLDIANAVAREMGYAFRTSVEEFPTWDMRRGLLAMGAPEPVIVACLGAMASEGFNNNLVPCEEAMRQMPRLKDVADVVAVTSPNRGCDTWMQERIRWMRTHFSMDVANVIFTGRKDMIRGDMFIDDDPANVTAWETANPGGRALLWDAPYNRTPYPMERVQEWEELIDIVKSR